MMTDRWEPVAFKVRIDEVLRRFVAQEADQFAAIDPLLGPVAVQLEAAVAEGKRLRAAFCYWGWRAGASRTATRWYGRRRRWSLCTPPRSFTTTSSTAVRCGTGAPRPMSPCAMPYGVVRAVRRRRGRWRC